MTVIGPPPFAAPWLEVSNLGVSYRTPTGRVIRAVRGVTLGLEPSETVGIVGESGCGKTTLARAIVGLVEPQHGAIRWQGRDLQSLSKADRRAYRRAVQMIFQDPFGSLNPRLSIGATLEEVVRVHGGPAAREALWRRDVVHQLLEDVGLDGSFGGRYPHEASGGQRQRVAIARALAVQPALIVADEPVSALDVSVQAQILNLLRDLHRKRGLGLVLIAHDLAVVRWLCQRVLVMYAGRVLEEGPAADVFRAPAHPYTQALMAAVPDPDRWSAREPGRLPVLPGEPPAPGQDIPGCPFHPRCAQAQPPCRSEPPVLRPVGKDHRSACFFSREA